MIVFMYPGQGSQKSGMGEAWVDHPSWELVVDAAETSGRDLETCARIGCVCAREVIQHIGPRPEANLREILRNEGLL